jgi:hypothetical protein
MHIIDPYLPKQRIFYKNTDCFILDENELLIKTVISFEDPHNTTQCLESLITKPEAHIVNVSDVKSWRKDGFYFYSYSMERLKPISQDERKAFHFLCHRYVGRISHKPFQEVKSALLEQSMFLDFDPDSVLTFYQSIINSTYIHPDVAPRNIMKKGNHFKLIDLERLTK